VFVKRQRRAKPAIFCLAKPKDALALGMQEAFGYKLSDLAPRHEGWVQANHWGGPEPLSRILGIDIGFDIARADANERASEPRILVNNSVPELENVHFGSGRVGLFCRYNGSLTIERPREEVDGNVA
jgi:hypothetical protein